MNFFGFGLPQGKKKRYFMIPTSSEWSLQESGISSSWVQCPEKNIRISFCSHFTTSYPIYLIFIGWIGEDWKFFWVPRTFEFQPTNEIFLSKREFPTFRKWPFLGVWCQKLSLGKIGVMDMSHIMDSGQKWLYPTFRNVFWSLSAESADLSKNQKKHFSQKKTWFFWSKICLKRARAGSIAKPR